MAYAIPFKRLIIVSIAIVTRSTHSIASLVSFFIWKLLT